MLIDDIALLLEKMPDRGHVLPGEDRYHAEYAKQYLAGIPGPAGSLLTVQDILYGSRVTGHDSNSIYRVAEECCRFSEKTGAPYGYPSLGLDKSENPAVQQIKTWLVWQAVGCIDGNADQLCRGMALDYGCGDMELASIPTMLCAAIMSDLYDMRRYSLIKTMV